MDVSCAEAAAPRAPAGLGPNLHHLCQEWPAPRAPAGLGPNLLHLCQEWPAPRMAVGLGLSRLFQLWRRCDDCGPCSVAFPQHDVLQTVVRLLAGLVFFRTLDLNVGLLEV